MANFDEAVIAVLDNEKGFVDHPLDRGGPTNYGITQATLSRYLKRPATVDDVKLMPLSTARAIYRAEYWQAIKGDDIQSQEVANYCLDMAVLRGVGAAPKAIQTVLGVSADGAIGPKTIAALNAYKPSRFLLDFYRVCSRAFVNIVVANSPQVVFLNGWLNRLDRMYEAGLKLITR